MSRLRARTWTAFERRVMYIRAALPGDAIPHRLFYTFHGICGYPGIPCEILPFREIAARIIRTKGIDLNSAYHRASADVEKHIDPVTGMGYKDLHDVENARDSKRRRDGNARWLAWRGRIELSRYANRKYPLKRRAPVSRVQIRAYEDWFMLDAWVPSENPNIYVKVRPLPPTAATITKTEIRPADAPEGTPWEVLA